MVAFRHARHVRNLVAPATEPRTDAGKVLDLNQLGMTEAENRFPNAVIVRRLI
jgi:hypothetical protein